MSRERYCIVELCETVLAEPNLNEVVKVPYIGRYTDKYSKLIDKDNVYSNAETKEILKNNSIDNFTLTTEKDYNKGSEIIAELSYLEERIDLNFEVLNWDSIEDYRNEIAKQGYESELLTEQELVMWIEAKNKR